MTSQFDTALYGMALINHACFFEDRWKTPKCDVDQCASYIFGMGEHIVKLLLKVATAVSFIFIAIGLTVHYLTGMLGSIDEAEMTQREIRLKVGFLVCGEAILGIFVDTVGVLCPPAIYEVHDCLKEQITRRSFEKLGIIDHRLVSQRFSAMEYFSKI